MNPYFTLITPSLQRESLLRTCASVDSQTLKNIEHLVMLDVNEIDEKMFCAIQHPNRRVMQCDYPHRNYGNSCRHRAWQYATGEMVCYLDDDNFLYDNKVLEDIYNALHGPLFDTPAWAIFPIHRHGRVFFHDPPGLCMSDTANVVAKREIARWPDDPEHGANATYTMDGHWIEGLKKYPYMAFPAFRPIVFMPKSSEGK